MVNNTYFSLVPSVAEYDKNTYYTIKLFNGVQMKVTEPIYSFDRDAGSKVLAVKGSTELNLAVGASIVPFR